MMGGASSWLCQADGDRRRVLEMERRLRPYRAGALVLFSLALAASGPQLGWWTLLPLVICAAGFALANRSLSASPRPEIRLAVAWLLSEICIAAGVVMTGGPRSPAAAWLAAPVVTLGARFGQRGLRAGSLCAIALMLAATFGVDPSWAIDHPQNLFLPASLIGAVSILSTAQMRSELEYRGAAAVDPLTGLLNRNALQVRVAELKQQSASRREPIGVVIIDVDRFKEFNDLHGHSVGDEVLRKCAARLGASLPAFDPVYRLGGEEFLVLLPGLDLDRTREVASHLCRIVSETPIDGLVVTVSCGASASDIDSFDYDRVLAAADEALYLAKRAGRNRIRAKAVGDRSRPKRVLTAAGAEIPAVGPTDALAATAAEEVAPSPSEGVDPSRSESIQMGPINPPLLEAGVA